MPKKYKPTADDIFFVSGSYSIYGMLRPIEEQLQKGGYRGLTLTDFNHNLCNMLEIEENPDMNFRDKMGNASVVDEGEIIIDGGVVAGKTLTKDGRREFRDYINKYSNLLELLIKNTPPEEYPEEVAEMKYHQTYIRMLKVFGSRQLFSDKLAFLANARNYDGDFDAIKERGNAAKKGVSREFWRHVRAYYPYSDLRDSYAELTNLACDREESREKETYAGEVEYREKYKKALQNYIAVNRAMEQGPAETERLTKLYLRDEIIKAMKNQDGPDKNVDYYGILKRVAEQETNGQDPDPEEKAISEDIKNRVNAKYTTDAYRFDWCNSRYEKELKAAGTKELNEADFTGNRGNTVLLSEVEAQINAIDMGWPVDELENIARLQLVLRSTISVGNNPDPQGALDYKNRCRTFYNERIKDKKYPATEEARQAFYRDFYALARESETFISGEFVDNTDDQNFYNGKWEKFSQGVKKTMEKKLSPVQKAVACLAHEEGIADLSAERINAIQNQINTTKRLGHIDSTEFGEFKRTFADFAAAYQANPEAFVISPEHGLSPENLELLKKVREKAKGYLNKLDDAEKNLDKRSPMGKARYEGAAKTFSLVHQLIMKHEKRLEDQAKVKKDAARAKGRKLTRDLFITPGSKNYDTYIDFAKKKAGGEEAYQAHLEAERVQEEEDLAKVPVTDDEKYEKLFDTYRLKKDAPAVTEGDELDSRIETLALIHAAKESQKAGKPYDFTAIHDRAKLIRKVYFMDNYFKTVSQNPNGPNGPAILRDALIYPCRADAVMHTLEECMYEVGQAKYGNTFVAQNKYQADLAEVLSRKREAPLSDKMKDLVEAINEVMRINLKDNTMVGMNAYKLRKANVKIMKAVHNVFDQRYNQFDKDAFAPKLALDTLAVLTTYTGCEPVTRKFLQHLNYTKKTNEGQKLNLNFDSFTRTFGVKHSKELAETMRRNAGQAGPAVAGQAGPQANQGNQAGPQAGQAGPQAHHPAGPGM